MAARARGVNCRRDHMASRKRVRIDTVLSLRAPEEERDLDLRDEAGEAKAQGMGFGSFPVPDRQVPRSEAEWAEVLEKVTRALSEGKNVVVHCRQGIGRSGLVAACLLVRRGMSPGAAVELVSAERGVAVPERSEQRAWMDSYIVAWASTK